MFTEGLASELAGTGVTVTALCPGFTRTEFHARAGIRDVRAPRSRCGSTPTTSCSRRSPTSPRGKVVSVPGAQWKVVTAGVRVLPRPLVRGGALRASTGSAAATAHRLAATVGADAVYHLASARLLLASDPATYAGPPTKEQRHGR